VGLVFDCLSSSQPNTTVSPVLFIHCLCVCDPNFGNIYYNSAENEITDVDWGQSKIFKI
jgi:hypothetical protein